jgi:DNA replication and repair protein RecF
VEKAFVQRGFFLEEIMILDLLKLSCYRNLAEINLTWDEHFNVIYGRNAQGKTNLLEAIYLLGNLKSFRSARGHELVAHDTDVALVKARVRRDRVAHELTIRLRRDGRTPRVDGKTVSRLSQFLGYVRTVLFTPEELSCLKGFPAARRSLLDRAILQTEPAYLDRVQEYERILRQRNQLLKQQVNADELEPWTTALVASGSRVRRDRIAYLQRFRPLLRKVYSEISGAGEEVELSYSATATAGTLLEDEMRSACERLESRERKLGLSLVGPHRDDLDFRIDGRSLKAFASQGQQRSVLLAYKAAQVMDLEERFDEAPILLLDDLASELDSSRQEGFFTFLLQRRGQVFLTSAQRPMLAEQLQRSASFFRVDSGKVEATTPKRG